MVASLSTSQNSDSSEIHHNVFYGPTAIGGPQYVDSAQVEGPPEVSVPVRAWRFIMLTWALCPAVAWSLRSVSSGKLLPRVTDLAHAAVPYIWLAGGIAVCLDAACCVLYRRWAVARQVVADPVTWRWRLLAIALGATALASAIYLAGHVPN